MANLFCCHSFLFLVLTIAFSQSQLIFVFCMLLKKIKQNKKNKIKYSQKKNESLKNVEVLGIPLLNFEGGRRVTLLNFEGGPVVPHLNSRIRYLGTLETRNQEPSQSLKEKPGTHLKLDPRTPQNLKVRPQDPLRSLKPKPQDVTIL